MHHHGALSAGSSLKDNDGVIESSTSPRAVPRSLDRLMIAAIAALTLLIAASVASILFDLNRLAVVRRIVSDTASANLARITSDIAAAHTSDNQTAIIGIVELCLLVIAAVCFIAWFHRAYTNLPRMGAGSLRHRPGWAIGAWFVPILNLWRPKQIANDIWRGSDPSRPGVQPSWSEEISPLLSLWWGAWLLSGLMGRLSTQDWNGAKTAHAIRAATRLDIADECLSIIAAGLAIIVVYKLSKRQAARASANLRVK